MGDDRARLTEFGFDPAAVEHMSKRGFALTVGRDSSRIADALLILTNVAHFIQNSDSMEEIKKNAALGMEAALRAQRANSEIMVTARFLYQGVWAGEGD